MNFRFYSPEHRHFIEALFEAIRSHYGKRLVSLVVYGSYARGENRFNSDIDLLIIVDSLKGTGRLKRTEDFVLTVENPLEESRKACEDQGISCEISTFIIDQKEAHSFSPLYLDMVEHHHVLVDKNHFFKNQLAQIKSRMQKWGSQKKQSGGHWYWEIKPGLKGNETIDYDK